MLTLRRGASKLGTSSVLVAPEWGGGLVGWMLGATPMLRRAIPDAVVGGNPHAMGCFPLLPYGNRIGGRRFRFGGTDYTLDANFGDNPHTIHGVGWRRAWTVQDVRPDAVALRLVHQPDPDWPFAFDAWLTYMLDDEALTIAVSLTNRHPAPAPAGIGVHPYLPRAGHPTLRFAASGAWRNGDDALPAEHGPVPREWRHETARAIMDSRLDNCFTGWEGTADIVAGPASLRLEASGAFTCLQVFTPSWADFFCVEPVSHVPDAANRPDLPAGQAMTILAPDATLSGTLRLVPTGGFLTGL